MHSSRTLCLDRSCTDVMAERRVGLFVFRCAAENDAARMTWLSAVMSVRSKSAANSGGSRRAAAGKRRKGRGPKKGLRSRIRSCAIWHEAGLKACGLPVHTYRARGKGFMVFQTVNGPPKGVVKRQSPPRERWAESISKVRYAKQSPCFMLDPGIHQR